MATNTLSDREWEVRLLFLDEVKDFLVAIETEIIGMSDRGLQRSAADKILRAAHSMKGGAAMMGFQALSDLSHSLEDFIKILQTSQQTTITSAIEGLLLAAVDNMRKTANIHKQRQTPSQNWLDTQINPPFQQLRSMLGELSAKDEANLLSEEVGQDMRVLMFSTEVDACLNRLADVIADPHSQVLREEFELTSQEFGCLGEMLELPAFTQLCHEINEALSDLDHLNSAHNLAEVTFSALETWRQVQALVLVGQFQLIPEHFAIIPAKSKSKLEKSSPQSPQQDLTPNQISNQSSNQIPNAIFDLNSELNLDQSLVPNLDQELDQDLGFELELNPEYANTSINSDIAAMLLDQSADQTIIQSINPSSSEETRSTTRISVKQLQNLSDRFGEVNAERSGMRMQLRRMRDLVQIMGDRMRTLEHSNSQLREAYDRVVTSSNSLIPTNLHHPKPVVRNLNSNTTDPNMALSYASRFDVLEMDQYSELHLLSREIMDSVVQLQEVHSDLETALAETESTERELGRASRQLQTAIEQTRMRMLSEVLGRFPRLLRDLSLEHGKQVELVLRGGSTLVERSILEILEDPLLHLLRNAFDHGIETPEARIAAGKPPKGRIEVAAGYRGNQTIITISDDGNGINFAKIRDRALSMGISEADLNNCSESDLLGLIFESGFSTADHVTSLSGRGVGMDVVRSNLNAIGGNVRIETELGKGTTFIMNVPVSLSIARVLLFEANGLQMAILTSAVEEILLVRETPIHTVANQEVLDWEGFSVAFLRIGDRLQFARPQFPAETENRPVVDEPLVLIVSCDNVPFGLQVDRYWGEQEVTIRSVQSPIPMPTGFVDCAILGGGKLVPLIDVDDFLNWAIADISQTSANPNSALVKSSSKIPPRHDQRSTVLVVDDSINVRRFLAMTLEKSGYRVEQARDGLEAMEKLKKLQTSSLVSHVDAVVCDIEMPRLDGFGFLAQSRNDQNCCDIPVVMLTSRSGNKHRDLAMRLGAAAYFTKPFKDNELLQTLSQIISKS